jgi:3-oxoacyl-[acyl-carrier protein] reductase
MTVVERELDGQVVLLTGASGGIGEALGRRLIGADARVAFTYGSRSLVAERLVAEAKDAGLEAIALPGDLADPRTPARLARETTQVLGPIAVLIANAGYAVQQAINEVDLETWDRTIFVHLRAPFLLAQQVLPTMVELDWGRLLFMSSVAGFMGGVVGPHYAASKAGLHGLVHFLASRVAAHGVTVNAVAPALIEDTGLLPATPDGVPAVPIPVGRYRRAEEVADLTMAVLRNGYLTNQVLSLDGGIVPVKRTGRVRSVASVPAVSRTIDVLALAQSGRSPQWSSRAAARATGWAEWSL